MGTSEEISRRYPQERFDDPNMKQTVSLIKRESRLCREFPAASFDHRFATDVRATWRDKELWGSRRA